MSAGSLIEIASSLLFSPEIPSVAVSMKPNKDYFQIYLFFLEALLIKTFSASLVFVMNPFMIMDWTLVA